MAMLVQANKVQLPQLYSQIIFYFEQCDGKIATDIICEDGGHLADLRTTHSFRRGHNPDISGALQ